MRASYVLLAGVLVGLAHAPTADAFQELDPHTPRTVVLLDHMNGTISAVETRWISPSSEDQAQFWIPRNATAALLSVTTQPGAERTWNLSEVSTSHTRTSELDNVTVDMQDLGDFRDHPVVGLTLAWSVNDTSVPLRLDRGDSPFQLYIRAMGEAKPVVKGTDLPLLVKGGSDQGYTYRTALLDGNARPTGPITVKMLPGGGIE